MSDNSIKWEIFRKAVDGKLTASEQKLFDNWLQESLQNRTFFKKAVLFYENKEQSQISEQELLSNAKQNFRIYTKHKRKEKLQQWYKVAAIVFIICLIPGAVYFLNRDTFEKTASIQTPVVIEPGKSKAILTVENVGEFLLEDNDTTISLNKNALSNIAICSGGITYTGKETEEIVPVNQKIEIPRGGEYFVYLPDSSKLYINSETTVTFSVPFEKDKRELFVEGGEVNLDVTKDTKRPFYVHTSDFTIKVLGTSFNVCSYPTDNRSSATLETGFIQLINMDRPAEQTIELKPNQQLVYNKTNGISTVYDVDASIYSAWTRGTLIFEEEPLHTIFSKLERWYDIEVEFLTENSKNELFTGKLPRFEDLQDILMIISKVSSSRIYIKDEKVYVENI